MKSRAFILPGAIFMISFLFSVTSLFSQSKVLTFRTAAEQGILYETLDSMYNETIYTDKNLNPEKVQSNKAKSCLRFLTDLGKYLKFNDFEWGKPTRLFVKIYVGLNGQVDYFLYYFMTDKKTPDNNFDKEKQLQMEKHIGSFVQEYKFQLADTRSVHSHSILYFE
jgi:hypothetical protein